MGISWDILAADDAVETIRLLAERAAHHRHQAALLEHAIDYVKAVRDGTPVETLPFARHPDLDW